MQVERGGHGMGNPGYPERDRYGLLTCQLVSGRPEICIRNIVRRGRGRAGRSGGPREVLLAPGTTSELHGEPLAFEVATICHGRFVSSLS